VVTILLAFVTQLSPVCFQFVLAVKYIVVIYKLSVIFGTKWYIIKDLNYYTKP
jgi:hypothetical protein